MTMVNSGLKGLNLEVLMVCNLFYYRLNRNERRVNEYIVYANVWFQITQI